VTVFRFDPACGLAPQTPHSRLWRRKLLLSTSSRLKEFAFSLIYLRSQIYNLFIFNSHVWSLHSPSPTREVPEDLHGSWGNAQFSRMPCNMRFCPEDRQCFKSFSSFFMKEAIIFLRWMIIALSSTFPRCCCILKVSWQRPNVAAVP
jgi:hypothetical protein